ncbi:hypothetical protein BDFB_003687, partial [Asbolus verrucosus]
RDGCSFGAVFSGAASMLLREHSLLFVLCSMSIMSQFDIIEDYVRPYATPGDNSCMYYVVSGLARCVTESAIL